MFKYRYYSEIVLKYIILEICFETDRSGRSIVIFLFIIKKLSHTNLLHPVLQTHGIEESMFVRCVFSIL